MGSSVEIRSTGTTGPAKSKAYHVRLALDQKPELVCSVVTPKHLCVCFAEAHLKLTLRPAGGKFRQHESKELRHKGDLDFQCLTSPSSLLDMAFLV